MRVMALLLESASSVVGLMTKPLLLVKLSCQLCIRSVSIVTQTWIEMLRAAIYLHLVIFWKLVIFAIAVLCLPIRIFTALYRERLLEMQLYKVTTELDAVLWGKKEMEGELRMAIKERKMVESMLAELEDEHDEAIAQIELLEVEVQGLKEEIHRSKEAQGKALWNSRCQSDVGDDYKTKDGNNLVASSLQSDYTVNQDKLLENLWEPEMQGLLKAESKVCKRDQPYTTTVILAKQREVALSRSLFSAILSLVVGIIVWESEDPCMPLVVSLFSVVFISLMSVVRFFSSLDHKPASEAVALLSFNWFILGTLTYPTLPRVTHALSPLAWSFLERTFVWLML